MSRESWAIPSQVYLTPNISPPVGPPNTVTDLAPDLASRIQQGSLDALEELYRAIGGDLLRLATRLTRDPAEAGDVVHDVFVGLPAALARYEERGQFVPWLRRVTDPAGDPSGTIRRTMRGARRPLCRGTAVATTSARPTGPSLRKMRWPGGPSRSGAWWC